MHTALSVASANTSHSHRQWNFARLLALRSPPSLPSVPSATEGGSTWLASFVALLRESDVVKIAVKILTIGFALALVVFVVVALFCGLYTLVVFALAWVRVR